MDAARRAQSGAKHVRDGGPGHRARLGRTRPIRLTLSGLFVIPLVSLVALWGFAATVTFRDAVAKRDGVTENRTIGGPSQVLLSELVQERLQSVVWLGSGRRIGGAQLAAQHGRTDTAVAAFRRASLSGPAQGAMDPTSKHDLAALLTKLDGLPRIRTAIAAGATTPLAAFGTYNRIADTEFPFFERMALINDISLYEQAEADIEAGRALEMVGREAALVGGALVSGGRMSPAEHVLFTEIVGNQRFLESDMLSRLPAPLAAPYHRLFASPQCRSFQAMERAIIASTAASAPVPVSPAGWQSGVQSLLASFNQAATQARAAVARGGSHLGNVTLLRLAVAGGAGLIAVAASIFLLVRSGRRITRELAGLQHAARDMAEERLPRVVERLRRGESVDVPAEVPPLTPVRTAEVAGVAGAFSATARTAVEAAAGQAGLRKAIGQVFLNLASRSQSLLHRQLAMLDAMERRTSDPDSLASLSRLGHLTTRMRRHAEGLIILSSAEPGRGWRSPVLIIDVLRGAAAEVEDHTRVDVLTQTRDAVAGTAVADVIHLLAELIENAASYSPRNTRVAVKAERVSNGFAVEIEDSGPGISDAEQVRLNERLTRAAEFGLADGNQLGLFVAGRLAARHGMRITLRRSPYGGTAAIVLMPHSIVVPGPEGAVGLTDRTRVLAGGAAGVSPAPAAGETHMGLPRRIPQASLAPQLRSAHVLMAAPVPESPVLESPVPESTAVERSPADVRALMASMQRGWERGRLDASGQGHGGGTGAAPASAVGEDA
jgi:signal transduction histidine kinase